MITSHAGVVDALRADDRGPAGPDLRRPASRSPSAPRRTASRRSSAPTTTRASRAGRPGRRRMPGRSSPASPARPTGSASASLVSPVTFRHPGNFAKVVTTVDEMSGGRDRGRRRRRLERARAPAARAAVPADQGARRPAWRTSSRSCTACGASPTAGRSTGTRSSIRGRRRSTRSRSRSRAGRGRRSAGRRPRIIVGGGGSPRAYRLAARYADEFNLSSSAPDRSAARSTPELDAACEAIGRDPATLDPLGDGRRRCIGRDDGRGRATARRAARGVRRGRRRRRRLARRATRALDHRDAGRGARDGPRLRRRPGVERIMLQDFLPVGPRHDRPDGRGAGRAGLTGAARPGPAGVSRRRRRPREVGRVVAADRVRVRAARAGEALGQELERRSPSRTAPPQGRAGRRLGDEQPPAGVRPGRAPGRARARIAADLHPEDLRGRRAWRARASARRGRSRSVRIRTSPVSGPVAGEVAVQERLEVAERRRQPGRLLDLEHELAAGRPVGARRDHEQVRASARRPAIASAPVSSRAPAARRSTTAPRVERPAGQVRADGRAGEHRADVADGVAPALVELAGLDHDVGDRCRRRAGR